MTTTTPISEPACVKSSALLGDKVSGYWNTRAEGYSLRTADELNERIGGNGSSAICAVFRTAVRCSTLAADRRFWPLLLPDAAGKLMAATPALKCSGTLLRMRRRPGLM